LCILNCNYWVQQSLPSFDFIQLNYPNSSQFSATFQNLTINNFVCVSDYSRRWTEWDFTFDHCNLKNGQFLHTPHINLVARSCTFNKGNYSGELLQMSLQQSTVNYQQFQFQLYELDIQESTFNTSYFSVDKLISDFGGLSISITDTVFDCE
jgi:hypothetical protein